MRSCLPTALDALIREALARAGADREDLRQLGRRVPDPG